VFRRGSALLAFLFPSFLFASIRINEVAFDEPTGSPDWVELYNAGTDPVLLDGYALDDGDTGAGKYILLPTGMVLPPQGYLVVMVDANGASDLDFSDGVGTVYTGTATTVNLAATEDQVALYSHTPLSSSTLVDFVSWVTDGDYGGADDRTQLAAATGDYWPADALWRCGMAAVGIPWAVARTGPGSGPRPFNRFCIPRAARPTNHPVSLRIGADGGSRPPRVFAV
jgi:hypothetical protein